MSLRENALRLLGLLLVARGKTMGQLRANSSHYRAKRARLFDQIWQEAAEEVGAKVEDMGGGYLRISKAGSSTFVNESNVMLDSRLALNMAGHKPLVHRLLGEVGAPVVRHVAYDLSTLREARDLLDDVGTVVVKPAVGGSAGGGVTTSIDSAAKLRKASLHASSFGRELLAEEQVEGDSYRLLYLKGEFIDGLRRDASTVVGDGRSRIRDLVGRENERRLGDQIVALHPLSIDMEMRFYLDSTNRRLDDVPKPGERVQVKRAVNQNAREENHCVRGVVHAENVELGARIAAALGVELAGVDVITPDIARPLAEVGGIINEVNTTPGLHHHYLISNPAESAPVAPRLLRYLLRPDGA